MTAGVLCSVYLLSTRNDFSVSELPADSVPAKIEYGELEKEIFIQFNWERLKKRLLTKIIDIYGNMDSSNVRTMARRNEE